MPTLRSRLLAAAPAALAFALAAPAAHAAPLAPSLSPDTGYAGNATGVRTDTIGTLPVDTARAAGYDAARGRLYAVGASDGDLAIIARHEDGSLDNGFGGNGRLTPPVPGGTDAQGTSLVVLPDGRLRLAGVVDTQPGGARNLDVVVLGLQPDGSLDGTFGTGGIATVPLNPAGDDAPTRMVATPGGGLALTGWTSSAHGTGADLTPPAVADAFVAVLHQDGTPAWTKVLDPGYGAGIAWRPGGDGPVVLRSSGSTAVLNAFHADGTPDPGFNDGNDVSAGPAGTKPAALLAYGGRLWAASSVGTATDKDALLSRVDGDGTGLQTRRFDIRGGLAGDRPVSTTLSDLAVTRGDADTLVVGGTMSESGRPRFAAEAFNLLDGSLSALGTGELTLTPEPGQQGGLVGLAGGPDGALAAVGQLSDTTDPSATSFGLSRLLVDAEKQCDLGVTVTRPLELVFDGLNTAGLTARVTNRGSRTCGGTLTVPAPYAITGGDTATGLMSPGDVRTVDLTIAHGGALPATDVLPVTIEAPADAQSGDDTATVPVRFEFCNVSLHRVGPAGAIGKHTTRRFEFTVRNRGTVTCRGVKVEALAGSKRVDSSSAYSIRAGLAATDDMVVQVNRAPRNGRRKLLGFRVVADNDAVPDDDAASGSPKAVTGADSDARAPRKHGRLYAGRASDGKGRGVAKSLLKVRRVDVAILRLGGRGCRWVASTHGSMRRVRAGKGHSCAKPVWMAATGRHDWHLTLEKRLPKGRYRLLTRAVQSDELAEASFGKRDRNRITFRVR